MKRRQISPAALPAIGQPFAGGFYAGRIYFDGAEFALIDAGQEFETSAHWWDHEGPRPRIRGATHRFDGMANTLAMSAEGSTIATKVLGMNIRGTWGWHIPSIEELQVVRSNLLQLPDWNHRMCESRATGVPWLPSVLVQHPERERGYGLADGYVSVGGAGYQLGQRLQRYPAGEGAADQGWRIRA